MGDIKQDLKNKYQYIRGLLRSYKLCCIVLNQEFVICLGSLNAILTWWFDTLLTSGVISSVGITAWSLKQYVN